MSVATVRRPTPLAVGLALAVTLSACAGGATDEATTEETAAPAAAGQAVFVGTGSVAWEATEVTAELADGQLEAQLVCEGAVPHNLIIEGVGDDEPLAECAGDDEASTTVELEPGTYTFYCNVPGHRQAGMEGELTVS